MKKITLIIPDGYDQVISVTAIGVTIHFSTTVTNVTTKAYEIENNGVYVLPIERRKLTMDDLISRQTAISFIENVPYIKDHPNMGDLIKEWLEQIPAVQPEKKIGQWLINPDGYYPYCSVCHNVQVNGKMTNYCPECGAYMKGESNDETASN